MMVKLENSSEFSRFFINKPFLYSQNDITHQLNILL